MNQDYPDNTRALIGVCTLNEADNIGPVIQSLRANFPAADILIVDDNSSDGTSERVSTLIQSDKRLRLVTRYDRGLGGAIRHAMQIAVDENYDFFLNLDGDLSHDPDQLPLLLNRALEQSPVDVVIGSRYAPQGKIIGWPIHRKLMSRMVNRFATLCLRLPVKDCSGSMRCYRVQTLREIGLESLRSNGYAVLEEILVRLDRAGASMAEVPITFTDRRYGQSKLTIREAVRSMSQMLTMAVKN